MNLSEVNWDPNAAGTWPLAVKMVIILLVCCVVAGAGVYFDTLDQLERLKVVEQQEPDLKKTFEEKQVKVANFRDYQDQLTQIEASLDEMIRQMPTEAEVASLLVDISQTGLASGLEFKLFKPEDPVPKEFYSELPIKIKVRGKYEDLGLFVSGLASLPRIVTIHDVNIVPEQPNDLKSDVMLMDATVKTYNESSGAASGASSSKRKKRGK